MCGITGYITNSDAEKKLIESLKLLEYRGYDSAGISILQNHKIYTTKNAGKIDDLEKLIYFNKTSTCGIAHTRWATHGSPNNTNAHPHLSNDKSWAVVHNGIIENFNELKLELKEKKYKFKSQTDTEVVCNMFQDMYNSNPIETLINVCNKLIGSYAFVCLNANFDNTLFLAKNKSPLFIASTKNDVMVASDVSCFVGKSNNFFTLKDGEFCKADLNSIIFYNKEGKIIKKKPKKLSNFDIINSKQNYPYYMVKEILEEPKVLKNLIETYKNNKILDKFDKNFISKFNKVVFVGCGTAYHASILGSKFLEDFTGISTSAHVASEFRYSNFKIDKKTLCIFVSQSGETADTIAATEKAKNNKATTIALTNVLYSTLAQACKYVLPVCAGLEIAVASSKAYTSQLSVLYMFAKHIQNEKFNKNENYEADILDIAKNIKMPNEKDFAKLVDKLSKTKNVFFIGRNYDYITALEASLKLKEITYIFSSEHPAGELKHGFLALIDKSSILFVIATNKKLLDKTLNGAFEAQSRGAKVIFVSQFDVPKEKLSKFYMVIKLQSFKEELIPITSIPTFQMLAYLTSVKKGLNPDQPRNLAKSVTVE